MGQPRPLAPRHGRRASSPSAIAYVIFQVWDFAGEVYDMAMDFVADARISGQVVTHVMRTRYNATGTGRLLALMGRAGFTSTERLDGKFYIEDPALAHRVGVAGS